MKADIPQNIDGISYLPTLPGKGIQKEHDCICLLYTSLLCFDKINIADPEVYGATYPLTRSVVAGLTIGF